MVTLSRSSAILIITFIIVSLPFVLAMALPGTSEDTRFSIYNTGWEGASELRSMFEDEGAKISTLVGSTNAINRLNNTNNGTLVMLGPALHYDPTESIAILMFLARGGRIVLADDFGTGNDFLSFLSVILGALSSIPMSSDMATNLFGFESSDIGDASSIIEEGEETNCSFIANPIAGIAINGSLLVDQGSYKDVPVQPVFKAPSTVSTGTSYQVAAPWTQDYLTGVTNGVVGNYASIITMKVRYPNNTDDETSPLYDPDYDSCDMNTWDMITKWVPMGSLPTSISEIYGQQLGTTFSLDVQISVLYSSKESWLESNLTQAKIDVNSVAPNRGEWGNPPVGFPVFFVLPLGAGEQAGGLWILSDPSIFTNLYLDSDAEYYAGAGYDNYVFTQNLIKKLMEDRPSQGVIFDEAHLAHSPTAPITFLAIYLKFLDMATMFPLLAPLLPLTVLGLSRKFMPKRTTGKPMLMTRVEQYYGRSFYAVKMRWFIEYKQYKRGLELIHRRLKRQLAKRYSLTEAMTPELLAQRLSDEFGDLDYKNTRNGFQKIEETLHDRSPMLEEEFMEEYLFLKGISDHVF